MGRVYDDIRIDGHKCLAIFDSGAVNTFTVPSVAKLGTSAGMKAPMLVHLGGRPLRSRERCILEGRLQRRRIILDAFVIPEIGPSDAGGPIEILVGALAMQMWGIKLDLRHERLDLTLYRREFIEY